jgi:predicted amidohydrolase
MSSMRVALVQMTSSDRPDDNMARAEELIRQAVDSQPDLVALPENFLYLRAEGDQPGFSEDAEMGEHVGLLRSLARELGVWILAGSIPERIEGSGKIHNTSLLLGRRGDVHATYRKIHLFDVTLPDGVELRESKHVAPGAEVVTADTDLCKVGLTVCYDLRFPELYRRLTRAGAEVIFVPSAFTAQTGKDHWHVLLRARAIENQVYIVAPAQVGRHSDRRQSYGHSLVADPWGKIVAEAADQEGAIVTADLDLEHLRKIRRQLPCLEHTRLL